MTAETDVAAPRRARALFPAKIVGPDRTIDKVKAILTIEGLFVYGIPPGKRMPETVLAIDPYADARHDGIGWVVTDASGGEWRITKGSGCGCGSPLKRLSDSPPKYLGVDDPATVQVL